MGFDLSAVQADITNYMRTQFPQFEFFVNAVPEEDQMPRDGENVLPFFVVQHGPMWPRPRGKSIAGPRNDDYFSWTQIVAISSVEEDAGSALSLVVDRLIGYRPEGGAAMTPDGGAADYGSRQYSVRPVLYYRSQRFEYSLTQSGLDGYIPVPPPPAPPTP